MANRRWPTPWKDDEEEKRAWEVYRAITSPWGREDGLGMYGHESGLGMYGHESGLGMLGDPDEFRFSPGFIFLLTDMDL